MKLHRLLLVLVFTAIAGCAEYGFTINDKVVYNPEPLFSDFDVADPALQTCLSQAIADAKASSASALQTLNCSHADIASLDGLEMFTGIRQLKLTANRIESIAPLAQLTALEAVYLENNRITDAVPLYHLPALAFVDLTGNAGLACPEQAALVGVETVLLPRQCGK